MEKTNEGVSSKLLEEIFNESIKASNERNTIQFSKENIKDLKTLGTDILTIGVLEIAKSFIDSDILTGIINATEAVAVAKTGGDYMSIKEKNKKCNQIEFNNDEFKSNEEILKQYEVSKEELENLELDI
ncbi:MAG: hypothetical protein ACLT40_00525 [Fusobacterium sp.]